MEASADAGGSGGEYRPNKRPDLGAPQAMPRYARSPRRRPLGATSSSEEEEGEIAATTSAHGAVTAAQFSSTEGASDASAVDSSGGSLRDRIDRGRWPAWEENSMPERSQMRPGREGRRTSSGWSERPPPGAFPPPHATGSGFPRDGRGGHGRWRDPRAGMYHRGHPRPPYDTPFGGGFRRPLDRSASGWSPANREALRREEENRFRSSSTPQLPYGGSDDRFPPRSQGMRDVRQSRYERERDFDRDREREHERAPYPSPPVSDRGYRSERQTSDVTSPATARSSRDFASDPISPNDHFDRARNAIGSPSADRTAWRQGDSQRQLSEGTDAARRKDESNASSVANSSHVSTAERTVSTESKAQSSQAVFPETDRAPASSEGHGSGEADKRDSGAPFAGTRRDSDLVGIEKIDQQRDETSPRTQQRRSDSERAGESWHSRGAYDSFMDSAETADTAARRGDAPVEQESSLQDASRARHDADLPVTLSDQSIESAVSPSANVALGGGSPPPQVPHVDRRLEGGSSKMMDASKPTMRKSEPSTSLSTLSSAATVSSDLSASISGGHNNADQSSNDGKSQTVASQSVASFADPSSSDEPPRTSSKLLVKEDDHTSSLSTLSSVPALSSDNVNISLDKFRPDEQAYGEQATVADEAKELKPHPSAQLAEKQHPSSASKQSVSRSGSTARVKESPFNVSQLLHGLIAKSGPTQSNDSLKHSIIAANRAKALQATAFERKPQYQDHAVVRKHPSPDAIERTQKKVGLVISQQRQQRSRKLEDLREQYRQLTRKWREHCDRLDRMQEARDAHKARLALNANVGVPGAVPALASQAGQPVGTPSFDEASLGLASSASMTRGNRRSTQTTGLASFGDAVRSEAEFLEILASLENADMQDPSARAARTTAVVPDMAISHDGNRAVRAFDDDNGFIANPAEFYFDTFDPDFWSEEEKVIFEKRYALYPKQFGKIALGLPHKTAKQCVNYYYLTKKEPGHDYKALLASKGRDRRRKTRIKPRKGRGSALMADLKGDEGEDESGAVQEELPPRRAAGRSRMLSGLNASEVDLVGEDGAPVESSGGRRRRAEDGAEIGRHGRARGPRRGKSDRRGRTNLEEMVTSTDSTSSEAIVAGAGDGALSALASLASDAASARDNTYGSARRKKGSKTLPGNEHVADSQGSVPTEETAKRSRQSTSSYWSVVERTEFLRSLATHGKDWDAIAANLSTKSAAQARNFFLRNAEEPDLVEAASLASENAALGLDGRASLANDFVTRRAKMAQVALAEARSAAIADASSEQKDAPIESLARDASPADSKRGLNISSLLNDATDDRRKPSVQHWFGKGEESDDDTEDETESQRRHDGVASAFRPPERRSDTDPDAREADSAYARTHATAPVFARYTEGETRPQRPLPSLVSPYVGRARDAPQASRVQSIGDQSGDHFAPPYGRETSGYTASLYNRAPPPRAGPTTLTMRDGTEGMWARHGYSQRSAGYPGIHLAPPTPTNLSTSSMLSSRGWQPQNTRDVYARPSSSPGLPRMSPSPSAFADASRAYERPDSSSSMTSQLDMRSSLSPMPYRKDASAPHAPAPRPPHYDMLSPSAESYQRPSFYARDAVHRLDLDGRDPRGEENKSR